MVSDLVTIQEAKDHLRIDDPSADDAWLSASITAITQAIASWVKVDSRLYMPLKDSSGEFVIDSSGEMVPELDSAGMPTPKAFVRTACLIELERQYRSRGGEDDTFMESFGNAGYGYVLGRGSTALLTSIRKPTIS